MTKFDMNPSVTEKWWPRSDGLIPVFAAVIEREGKWLLGQRPIQKRHGGLWEFPGGKLEPGESLTDAAGREISEELGVTVARVGEVQFKQRDENSAFEIIFVEATIMGSPRPLEHMQLAWVDRAAASDFPLAPTDLAFVVHVSPHNS